MMSQRDWLLAQLNLDYMLWIRLSTIYKYFNLFILYMLICRFIALCVYFYKEKKENNVL